MNRLVIAAVFPFALSAPALAQESPYDARGPYAVKQTQAAPGCHVFRPIKPEPKPSPVILWGNGTNTMAAIYSPMLVQWASHGFVVAASMDGNAGSGKPLLDCLDYLAKENAREHSVLKGAVDLSRVGAAGHSQGAAGAIMAGRDPRITATAPIQPYTAGSRSYESGAETQQHGPMLLLSGQADSVADPATHQQPIFEKANVPVFWSTLAAAGHSAPSTGTNGPYRPATTAWFLWQLAGDEKAGEMFKGATCGYCATPAWTVQKKGVE